MRMPWMVLLGVAACEICCFAESNRTVDYRFWKDLEFAAAGQQEDVLFAALDSEVYGGTRPGCPDLRIYDGQRREMPYVLEKCTDARTQPVRRESVGKTVALRELPDNRIEVTWELDDKQPPVTLLTIESPLKDFEKHVSVFGAAQDGTEAELVHEALVCDYSRYMDIRRMEVTVPDNSCRRYRVLVDDIVDTQSSPLTELERTYRHGDLAEEKDRTTVQRRVLRIERIRGWHTVAEERTVKDRKTAYGVASFKSEQNEKDRLTVVTVRMRREPLTALVIETPNRNFSRPVTVEEESVDGTSKTWARLAESSISVVQFRSFHDEKLRIEFPERRSEEYRLTIRNADNAPLHVTGIRAEGNVYRLCWLARPEAGIRLYYGSEAVGAPAYDAAVVLAALGKGIQGVEGKLLAQQANPAFKSPVVGHRGLLESKALFLGVVCLVVALLGWGLFRAGRKMETMKEE